MKYHINLQTRELNVLMVTYTNMKTNHYLVQQQQHLTRGLERSECRQPYPCEYHYSQREIATQYINKRDNNDIL